jgi:beta-carotene hydroxylase
MSADLAALNKEAIAAARKHMGGVAWLTVALTFFVVMSFVASLALYAHGLIPPWAATAIVAVLTYFSYTPLHEAAHKNINGDTESLSWLNDLCGYLVAPIIGVPYASHRFEHFTHHRYTNQPDKDPDFVISELNQGVRGFFSAIVKFLWNQNAFFALHNWSSATLKERLVYCLELTLSIGWRVVFISLVAQPWVVLVILGGYFLGGFFTGYWFAYRPHLPYQEPKRYQNTNSLIMPTWMKPFEWIWLGQNLHSIHHLFPRVPFYRYHALHREIEPVLRAHGTPIVGIFSRQPIAASDKHDEQVPIAGQ